ncbi:MAG: serine/threonine-protein kinase [Thermoanaerobaculia bacterium]|nr:serine/threonine-protein kinase [Thermoanaerobaculia bacterium]
MSSDRHDPRNLGPHDLEARVDQIFDRALDVPRAERSAFLDLACAEDAVLRARVERLLAFSDDPPSLFEHSPSLRRESPGELLAGQEPSMPSQLGPYRILEEIGRGGMGVVYLGVRADGHFEQQVAVKVMQAGTDSPEARRRFEQERQIIASLQHANIAHLYDGGVTEDGRPYSAMELVEGQPIHVFCDEQGLGIDQRLQLVEVVARAVHHAHQSLVVHCDLKPSNILVTAQGEIKLLDFGVAKLLDAAATGRSSGDRLGSRAVTPLYASPEQVRGEAVTTASDIYQLGLLLFELLTGRRARELAIASGAEAGDVPADPLVAPSTAVREATAEQATTVAAARGTRPRELLRSLLGDLDRIVQAAMRVRPEQRFRSAAELAEELKRYRQHEPLTVRPGTLVYRARLFARRNRLAAVVAALLVVLLIGYSVTVTVQARRILRERDRAQRIQAFALGLYGAGDPNQALGPEVAAAELVAHGVARAEAELVEEPAVQAEVKQYFGNVYNRLGLFAEAEAQLRDALALSQRLYGEVHAKTAEALDALGRVLLERNVAEALPLLEQALEQRRRFLGNDHPDTARTLAGLGACFSSAGLYQASEQHFREALDIQRRNDPDGVDVASTLSGLAWTVRLQNRPEEAEPLLQEALKLHRQHFGDAHPEVASAWNNLANSLWELERWEEGDEAMHRSIQSMKDLYGDTHPDIATSLGNLAGSRSKRGELEGAAALYRQAMEMRESIFGPSHRRLAQTKAQLAEVLHRAGNFAEAALLFEESLSIFREQLSADHPSFGRVWRGFGSMWLDAGELDRARQALNKARAVYAGMEGSSWPWRIDVMLAEIERKQGRLAESRILLEEAEGKLGGSPEWSQRWQREMALLDAD